MVVVCTNNNNLIGIFALDFDKNVSHMRHAVRALLYLCYTLGSNGKTAFDIVARVALKRLRKAVAHKGSCAHLLENRDKILARYVAPLRTCLSTLQRIGCKELDMSLGSGKVDGRQALLLGSYLLSLCLGGHDCDYCKQCKQQKNLGLHSSSFYINGIPVSLHA